MTGGIRSRGIQTFFHMSSVVSLPEMSWPYIEAKQSYSRDELSRDELSLGPSSLEFQSAGRFVISDICSQVFETIH